jgi:hypothetical protein
VVLVVPLGVVPVPVHKLRKVEHLHSVHQYLQQAAAQVQANHLMVQPEVLEVVVQELGHQVYHIEITV